MPWKKKREKIKTLKTPKKTPTDRPEEISKEAPKWNLKIDLTSKSKSTGAARATRALPSFMQRS